MKIAIISFTFQLKYFNRRWELFAEMYPDTEVYLLTQDKSEWYGTKGYSFGTTDIHRGVEFDNGNFHIRTFHQKNIHFFGWYSGDFQHLFNEIKPDIIYFIGGHCELALAQVLRLRQKLLPSTKVLAFSMRGPHHNLHIDYAQKGLAAVRQRLYYYYNKCLLKYINNRIDSFFCHYPDALQAFRDEGYAGPVYMQTQVGVNPEWFYINPEARNRIRQKYNISDSTYVFGTAVRFAENKGIYNILEALPLDGDWKYLMMGSGSEEENNRFKQAILEKHLEDRVILTGLIDRFEMADYWNAVDCAVHVPLTGRWVETFSLSVIQPMLLKKPIIGNTSGSVPYQIGSDGLIVNEGDISQLHEKMQWVMEHPKELVRIGDYMNKRANHYTIHHLNKLFYMTLVDDVLTGSYSQDKIDMALWEEK